MCTSYAQGHPYEGDPRRLPHRPQARPFHGVPHRRGERAARRATAPATVWSRSGTASRSSPLCGPPGRASPGSTTCTGTCGTWSSNRSWPRPASSSSTGSPRRCTAAPRSSPCRSRRAASSIDYLGLRPAQITVVPPGHRRALHPGGGPGARCPLVVAVGRLMPSKRFDELVRIAAETRRRRSRSPAGHRRRRLRAPGPRGPGGRPGCGLVGAHRRQGVRRRAAVAVPTGVGGGQHVDRRGMGHDPRPRRPRAAPRRSPPTSPGTATRSPPESSGLLAADSRGLVRGPHGHVVGPRAAQRALARALWPARRHAHLAGERPWTPSPPGPRRHPPPAQEIADDRHLPSCWSTASPPRRPARGATTAGSTFSPTAAATPWPSISWVTGPPHGPPTPPPTTASRRTCSSGCPTSRSTPSASRLGARTLLDLAGEHPERFHSLVVAGVGANLFRDR